MAIVGAGAAGLATAIFTRRLATHHSVLVCEGAKKPGAKILVSGGSRCNVTNVSVSDADFWGGRRAIVRRVLRAFPVSETVAFFRELGVPLHQEADGKLFPDSNRARDVLDALLRETDRVGVRLLSPSWSTSRAAHPGSRSRPRTEPSARTPSSSRPADSPFPRAAATAPVSRWRDAWVTPSCRRLPAWCRWSWGTIATRCTASYRASRTTAS